MRHVPDIITPREFKLTFRIDNAAFMTSDSVAEIIAKVAAQVTDDLPDFLCDFDSWPGRSVRDMNGNTIGSWEITEGEVGFK